MGWPVRHLPVIQQWDCHGCGECCREYEVHVTEAERQLRRSAALYSRHLGPKHAQTLMVSTLLADTINNLGRTAEAAQLIRATTADLVSTLGPEHVATNELRGFQIGRAHV